MSKKLIQKLAEFRDLRQVVNLGSLGTGLVITRKAQGLSFPLDPESFITPGGGQVSGLNGKAINKILREHGVGNSVGTETGRTSCGTPNLARFYVKFLNELHGQQILNLNIIEKWWVERLVDCFNTEPFRLVYDQSKTLMVMLRNLLEQATERQRKSPGKTYVGAVLQHLVGAKLALALPEINITHNGFSVADSVSARLGDFAIDDAVIHCTTAPNEALILKCKANLESGKRPIILTIAKMMGAAEGMAETLGIDGRIEIMDALQFLTANLYEMSLFKASERRITVEKLVEKYNEVVSVCESDASLRIGLG